MYTNNQVVNKLACKSEVIIGRFLTSAIFIYSEIVKGKQTRVRVGMQVKC